MYAFLLVPDQSIELVAGSETRLAIVFQNFSNTTLHLSGVKAKGKEQFKEDPRPLRIEGAVQPCYFATILVQFTDAKEVLHSERVPLTASGYLPPGKEIVSIVSLRLPQKAGVYKLVLGQIEPAKDPSTGTNNVESDSLLLWKKSNSSVTLQPIPVSRAKK